MKKLFLVALVAIFSVSFANAQETNFGVTAGYVNGASKVKNSAGEIKGSDAGFYAGVFAELGLSEKIKLQPEILYTNIDEVSFLQMPIMAKFYVSEKLNLMAGPQLDYSLEETSDDFTALGVSLGFGAGYDITDNILISTKYAFQVNNSYTGNASDASFRTNFFNIGLGYRF